MVMLETSCMKNITGGSKKIYVGGLPFVIGDDGNLVEYIGDILIAED